MSDGAITVLDGASLRSIHLLPPSSDDPLTGAQILDLADSKASEYLLGVSLPQTLKSSALKRVNVDDVVTFRRTELSRDAASEKLNNYVAAIANELKDNPLVVSMLDGNTVRMFLEDEDDFAMLAENLFTDLDTEDKGKIAKSEIRNALENMGVEMGIPPFEDFPLVNDILKRNGIEEKEELGQSQFAELLQTILQEVADALSVKHVTVIHKLKINNGLKLRKLLADENLLSNVLENIMEEKVSMEDNQVSIKKIRGFLELRANELGLPPPESSEAVLLLYDTIFADVETGKHAPKAEDEFRELVKEILKQFAEQLEANPIYCDLDN
ncbi:hypothetical protein K2173_006953 [Erythroxylum novogranatense]|uniref:EF-hand domain-containing protein n=1 Tax=Erythroxylum novogranatense TaxID=1862640 RepID=A0AAV8SZF3_9ROSI|nr:hypothetical protein K2173_006953 [Erythroxylum novogranatense]